MKSPIRILIFASLLVGLFTFKNYGESWDEPDIYRYGEYALDAYQYITHPQDLPNFDTNLDFYGPAYFILVSILAQGLMTIFPTWSVVEAWHLLYFLTFLAGVYVFYLLARRWLSEWAALGVTLLFLTQPLLWGHAFINPKDTPFMVFFMMSVYFGLRFMDAELRLAQRWVWVALAGIFLGLTISLRVLGPLAGMIVLANAGMKDWRKTLVYSVPYLCHCRVGCLSDMAIPMGGACYKLSRKPEVNVGISFRCCSVVQWHALSARGCAAPVFPDIVRAAIDGTRVASFPDRHDCLARIFSST